jgi:hypothetical protein
MSLFFFLSHFASLIQIIAQCGRTLSPSQSPSISGGLLYLSLSVVTCQKITGILKSISHCYKSDS